MSDSSAAARKLAAQLSVRPEQAAATIALLDGGNTLPFIARYRKEQTGGLDEDQIRRLEEALSTLRALEERRAAIVAAIREGGALTPDLAARLAAAETRTALEDLYAPYRPKRRTRAAIARERGLGPLADLIAGQPPTRQSPEQLARPFLGEGVATVEEALAGARDIVAEAVAEHPDVRRIARERALRGAVLRCERIDGAEDPRAVYAASGSTGPRTRAPSIRPTTPSRPRSAGSGRIRCWRSVAARPRRFCG